MSPGRGRVSPTRRLLRTLLRLPLVLLSLLAVPVHAQEGIALASGGTVVELLPSPARLIFHFRDADGAPVDASSLRGRVVLRSEGT